MNEFKQKLEETLNRLYKENKISIDVYSELMEFADPNQALQLQQTGVMVELPEYELNFCEKCFQMTNHLNGICKKCKSN